MITIELNDHTAEDVKCIQELQAMGFPDEYIQELYNKTLKTEKEKRLVKVNDKKGSFADIGDPESRLSFQL